MRRAAKKVLEGCRRYVHTDIPRCYISPVDILYLLQGIDTNSTYLRALMTTECYDLLLEGQVSSKAMEAVNKTNGHTTQVAKIFYQMRSREDDAQHSLTVASVSTFTCHLTVI